MVITSITLTVAASAASTDWRLPTVQEIHGLTDYNCYFCAIHRHRLLFTILIDTGYLLDC